jgi:peptide deformylase
MEVYKFGSDVLRTPALEVKEITEEIKSLLDDMIETMILAPGIGLAGPQVGKSLRLFVMNVEEGVYEKIINPEILNSSGVDTYNEGCLSFPEIFADVVRSKKIKVRYLNENGVEIVREADGLWARCFQHEFDHLNGRLFVDHLSKKQLRMIKGNLNKICAAAKSGVSD